MRKMHPKSVVYKGVARFAVFATCLHMLLRLRLSVRFSNANFGLLASSVGRRMQI